MFPAPVTFYISSIFSSESIKSMHFLMTQFSVSCFFIICLIVHSHTIRHLIFRFCNSSFTILSRLTLSSNFLCQNSCLDFGIYAYLHP